MDIQSLHVWPEVAIGAAIGGLWGALSALSAKAMADENERDAIEEVGIWAPTFTAVSLVLFVSLTHLATGLLAAQVGAWILAAIFTPELLHDAPGSLAGAMPSVAYPGLLGTVHVAATLNLLLLDSHRSFMVVLFPLLGPAYAMARITSRTDGTTSYLRKIAGAPLERYYRRCGRGSLLLRTLVVAAVAAAWAALLLLG